MQSLSWVSLAALLVLNVGCALKLKPTKAKIVQATPKNFLVENAKKPVKVTDQTRVVDGRKRFDFQMAHYPGAIHLRWESFVNPRARFPGRLLEETDKLIQRLSLKGIHPDQPVIVVGEGRQGDASAGRLAWTLFYLGISNIQVVGSSSLGLSSNIQQDIQLENVKPWKLPGNGSMIATKKDVLAAVTSKPVGNKRSAVVLDVRTEAEYFKKKGFGSKYALPDLGAMNIEWKEFYTQEGRPSLQLRNRLSALGITTKMKIIVISNKGVRSAAAHFALAAMGYEDVQNFIDGYKGLL